MLSRLPLFPVNSTVKSTGHLVIGECDTTDLTAEFGTPLYVFDEADLRGRCREFRAEFGRYYHDINVVYACKAFISPTMAGIMGEEKLGLDVVSSGELEIARSAGFPMERVYLHGNNKSAWELDRALQCNVGHIVVDNLHELKMLEETASKQGSTADILLRITPGIDPHTHSYIATGIVDSKFGIPLSQAEEAISIATSASSLNLTGLHCHIGSLIFEPEPYLNAIDVMVSLAADMESRHGFTLSELNIGGGFAIQYTLDTPAPPISRYAETISSRITSACQKRGLGLPRLTIEPGRSVIGRCGVALYEAGAIKDIPGIRRYVSIDGGMGDNIRPALYGARYEAVIANKMMKEESQEVTIAGRYCESGDILISDIRLPSVTSGDIIAIPGCGAYCLPMSSNYNASLKPAVVMVNNGKARLIRRRETVEDLLRCDTDRQFDS